MAFEEEKEKTLKRTDRSLKGGVDEQIAGLVLFLNSCDDYFTTSSCSGRICLLVPGEKKHDTIWLLKSHEQVGIKALKKALAKLPKEKVWFRMQSLIIHITCRNLEAAKQLLQCSQESGLKRSGLVLPLSSVRVLIEGSDLLNAPVAEKAKMLVSDEYLAELLEEANAKLKRNSERIARFEAVCRERMH